MSFLDFGSHQSTSQSTTLQTISYSDSYNTTSNSTNNLSNSGNQANFGNFYGGNVNLGDSANSSFAPGPSSASGGGGVSALAGGSMLGGLTQYTPYMLGFLAIVLLMKFSKGG